MTEQRHPFPHPVPRSGLAYRPWVVYVNGRFLVRWLVENELHERPLTARERLAWRLRSRVPDAR